MAELPDDDQVLSIKSVLRSRSFRAQSATVNSSNIRASNQKISRPRTAPARSRSACNRVYQLEQESSRWQSFESHLPVKKPRPAPWQKTAETPLVPYLTGPGYILSRSKSKFAAKLNLDEFFNRHPEESQRQSRCDPERETLLSDLNQQILDLTLYLEDERLSHRQTRIRTDDTLKARVIELRDEHASKMIDLESNHETELSDLKTLHEKEHKNYRTAAESEISRLKNEMEFLQGAFNTYRGTILTEMQEKWEIKEKDLIEKCDKEKEEDLHEIKTKLVQERNSEKVILQREWQKKFDATRKDHQRELDSLQRRFASAAEDQAKLKVTVEQLQSSQLELEQLQGEHEDTCRQLNNTISELADMKLKLRTFEEQFQNRVSEFEDQYRQRMDAVRSQNTEIRRLYVQKCGEVFDERAQIEQTRINSVKDAMKTIIEIKSRTNVSMVGDSPFRELLSRRISTPCTESERKSAMQESSSDVPEKRNLTPRRQRPKTVPSDRGY